MRILFIGGSGVISSASAELALARGIELYLLNRGERRLRGRTSLRADIRDRVGTRAALAGLAFDAVVDWVAFRPEHVAADIELFRGRTAQYVFISSATVYEKPPRRLPITESTRSNPFWPTPLTRSHVKNGWSRRTGRKGFPVSIVRPSHTYDCTKLPTLGYYTAIARLRVGKPPWSTATGPRSGC